MLNKDISVVLEPEPRITEEDAYYIAVNSGNSLRQCHSDLMNGLTGGREQFHVIHNKLKVYLSLGRASTRFARSKQFSLQICSPKVFIATIYIPTRRAKRYF